MEREDEEYRTVETGCQGGQGSPRAVVPSEEESEWENCQTNVYMYGLYYMLHLNTFQSARLISWVPWLYENIVQHFPPIWILGFCEVHEQLMYSAIEFPFLPWYLMNAENVSSCVEAHIDDSK
jgi:hypothetical protein